MSVAENRFPDHTRLRHEREPAGNPFRLPWSAWWRIVKRVAGQYGEDNLTIIAAGCAFFTLLALLPAITAILLLYSMMADASEAARQVQPFIAVLPGEAARMLSDRITEIASSPEHEVGAGIAVAVGVAWWSSSNAVRATLNALNIVYSEREKRHFIRLNLSIFGFTLAAIFGFVLVQFILALVPTLLLFLGVDANLKRALILLRWPLLAGVFMGALVLLYRLAPSREQPRWSWVLPGALFATIAWLVASGLFALYVANFANFDALYGSFGAIVVLLLWLNWTFIIVLLGAELNSELEREVMPDTTTGTPEPLGQRGAIVADTVALRPDISHEENARPKEAPL